MMEHTFTLDEIFAKRADRVPVITVEKRTGRILGLNLTNRAAFDKTVETGTCFYYDDVNDAIFLKGEHSQEIETIDEIRLDCCHARRHDLHFLYLVDMAEGKCMFGMKDCHFYVFRDGQFTLDAASIIDNEAVLQHKHRIKTLLTVDEDVDHKRRFTRKK